jgi:hypothetical protein
LFFNSALENKLSDAKNITFLKFLFFKIQTMLSVGFPEYFFGPDSEPFCADLHIVLAALHTDEQLKKYFFTFLQVDLQSCRADQGFRSFRFFRFRRQPFQQCAGGPTVCRRRSGADLLRPGEDEGAGLLF